MRYSIRGRVLCVTVPIWVVSTWAFVVGVYRPCGIGTKGWTLAPDASLRGNRSAKRSEMLFATCSVYSEILRIRRCGRSVPARSDGLRLRRYSGSVKGTNTNRMPLRSARESICRAWMRERCSRLGHPLSCLELAMTAQISSSIMHAVHAWWWRMNSLSDRRPGLPSLHPSSPGTYSVPS